MKKVEITQIRSGKYPTKKELQEFKMGYKPFLKTWEKVNGKVKSTTNKKKEV